MLTARDITGLYAIIPTPARADAASFAAVDTVDLAETERLVNQLIDDGASGIIALGTTGECATLTSGEYRSFVETLLRTVDKRVPTVVGATALGAHEVRERIQVSKDNGADAVLLGMPMWQPLTTRMAVEYYRQVSLAFPDVGVMVYANARAFRYDFPLEFWEAVAREAPTVMSAKSSRPNGLKELHRVTGGRVHFVPIDSSMHDFYAVSPGTTTACWATAASMGPAPSLAMVDAVRSGDSSAISAIGEALAWANEPIKELLTRPELFASYNIQVEKARIAAAGYCRPGPVRPPYDDLPAEYLAMSNECGKRWAELCTRYTKD